MLFRSESFSMEGNLPRSVIIINIEAAYTQCASAVLRSNLWDVSYHVSKESVPTIGEMLEAITQGKINADEYNSNWPTRAKTSMW